jgi:hypothetical protein
MDYACGILAVARNFLRKAGFRLMMLLPIFYSIGGFET